MNLASGPPATIHAMPRIPNDILLPIWKGVIFNHDSSWCNHNPCVAFRLASVCREWRYLALSTPRLWSDIHLHERSSAELLALLLSRSQETPLTICIDGEYNLGHLDLAASKAHRWRRLIVVNCQEFYYVFKKIREFAANPEVRSKGGILTEVSIYYEDSAEESDIHPSYGVNLWPQLTKLCFTGR